MADGVRYDLLCLLMVVVNSSYDLLSIRLYHSPVTRQRVLDVAGALSIDSPFVTAHLVYVS